MGREWGSKRIRRFALAALLAAALPHAQAAAEGVRVEVFVCEGAMERGAATALVRAAREAYPQTEWTLTFERDAGETLRERVLMDDAPQIALCAPQEARPWAKEGLLLPLEGRVADLTRMAPAVVEACVEDESLFLAPLVARRRSFAANADAVERLGYGQLLDTQEHPAILPSELYRLMEEASLSGMPPMEIWLPEPGNSAGLEAFVQGLYCGRLASADGELTAQDPYLAAGLSFLASAVREGLVPLVRDRETALEHFLSGQALFFADWTEEEAARAREREPGFAIAALSYPSSDGARVNAFDVTGAAVFAGHDARAVGAAMQAAALFCRDERALAALGERGVFEDGGWWLPCLSAMDEGATWRSLFCEAMRKCLRGEEEAEQALDGLSALAKAAQG